MFYCRSISEMTGIIEATSWNIWYKKNIPLTLPENLESSIVCLLFFFLLEAVGLFTGSHTLFFILQDKKLKWVVCSRQTVTLGTKPKHKVFLKIPGRSDISYVTSQSFDV